MNTNSYQTPVFIPRGVSNENGTIGYISNYAGGIDSIDLTNGNFLWRTDSASYPLIVWKNSLVAFRRIEKDKTFIEIIVLDSNQQVSPLFTSKPIEFPAEVDLNSQEDIFSLQVYLDFQTLILIYSVQPLYRGGAAPQYQRGQTNKVKQGKISVNLITGQSEINLSDGIDDFHPQTRPPSQGKDFYEIETWKIGEKAAALLGDFSDGKSVIYLQFWNSETLQNYHLTRLMEGEGLVTRKTLDGLFVLIHSETERSSAEKWKIFSVETGREIAVSTLENETKEVSVLFPQIFYLVEKNTISSTQILLKAKDSRTDLVLWEIVLFERENLSPRSLRK